MAQSYKSNFIVGAQATYRNAYCEGSFSAWDFAVTGEGSGKISMRTLATKYEANSMEEISKARYV